jgi:lysophospholipase L1-like esterase
VRRPARGGRELLLLAATLLALLGLGEAVARLVWEDPSRPARPIPPEWQGLPNVSGLWALAKPNVRGLASGALFETNSAGFRGGERTLAKPPGVFRIAIVGDSIAMGMGVVEAETYAARLERALSEAHPDRRFEVMNFGLSGLNAYAVVDRLQRLALPYDPDLVVYGYTLNDIEGPAYRRSVDFTFIDPRTWAGSPVYLVRVLGPRLASLRELLWAPRGSYSFELDDNYFHNPEAWQAVEDALDRVRDLAHERGICAVVFVHARLYWLSWLHPYHRHYEIVMQAARARGLAAIEAFPAFRGESAQSLWIGPLDPHPNARGHEILAGALFAGLEALPPGCWELHPPSSARKR